MAGRDRRRHGGREALRAVTARTAAVTVGAVRGKERHATGDGVRVVGHAGAQVGGGKRARAMACTPMSVAPSNSRTAAAR